MATPRIQRVESLPLRRILSGLWILGAAIRGEILRILGV